jgi:hypothetical protein
MKTFGYLFFFVGLVIGMYAFTMDTSVSVTDALGLDRVSNLSLMNEKQNLLFVAGTMCIVGAIFLGAAFVAESVENSFKIVDAKTSMANFLSFCL